MLLGCRNIKKYYGDRKVLNGVNLDVHHRDRIGLIGRNGTGKTTLADILTGNLDYDEGTIITPREKMSLGYLRQEENHFELLVSVLNNRDGLNGEFQRLASHLGINRLGNWEEERLKNISGGEKTKLALARIFAAQPDLIILDEPTNHMDHHGIDFMVSELAAYQGAVIIISHDRYFLDRTVSQIAELENGIIKVYQGNYTLYREAKKKERESQLQTYNSQQKEQQKIEDAIARLRRWSAKAHRESREKARRMIGGKEYYRKKAKKQDRAVKSQIKRLEKMRRTGMELPPQEAVVSFNLSSCEKGGRRLLVADAISKAYGNLQLFQASSFYINRGEKAGVFGPNGCGKTTLLKAILGKESLDGGKILLSKAAKVAYVSQEVPQEEKHSLRDRLVELPLAEQKDAIQSLINLGIPYDRFRVSLGDLSRGERRKIELGMAVMGDYDLLILDEPTNHLDLFSREALEESLMQFPGSILLVTHDQYLMEHVCDHLLVFENNKISRIEGRLPSYLARRRAEVSNTGVDTANGNVDRLLLETKISRVLSELSLLKPDDPSYPALDQEYQTLLRIKRDLL